MGRFVKGDVVVVPFLFSDLSAAKKRPALVVASLTGEDVILCQITSQTVSDAYVITHSCKHRFFVRQPASKQQYPPQPHLYSGFEHHSISRRYGDL
jgi:hypothetical protein